MACILLEFPLTLHQIGEVQGGSFVQLVYTIRGVHLNDTPPRNDTPLDFGAVQNLGGVSLRSDTVYHSRSVQTGSRMCCRRRRPTWLAGGERDAIECHIVQAKVQFFLPAPAARRITLLLSRILHLTASVYSTVPALSIGP